MSAHGDDARPGGDADEPGLLRRWSARKRGAEARMADDRTAPASEAGSPPDAMPDAVPRVVPEDALADASSGAPGAAAGNDSRAAPGAGGGAPDLPDPDADPNADPGIDPAPTDADMPPIDSLRADSDLSAFFSDGVSAALRRAALRHVFALPAYNVRDGLNDYDGDYTVFEPLGDTVTADMKFHAARLERKRLEEERLEEERLEGDRLARERVERDAGIDADATTERARCESADELDAPEEDVAFEHAVDDSAARRRALEEGARSPDDSGPEATVIATENLVAPSADERGDGAGDVCADPADGAASSGSGHGAPPHV